MLQHQKQLKRTARTELGDLVLNLQKKTKPKKGRVKGIGMITWSRAIIEGTKGMAIASNPAMLFTPDLNSDKIDLYLTIELFKMNHFRDAPSHIRYEWEGINYYADDTISQNTLCEGRSGQNLQISIYVRPSFCTEENCLIWESGVFRWLSLLWDVDVETGAYRDSNPDKISVNIRNFPYAVENPDRFITAVSQTLSDLWVLNEVQRAIEMEDWKQFRHKRDTALRYAAGVKG